MGGRGNPLFLQDLDIEIWVGGPRLETAVTCSVPAARCDNMLLPDRNGFGIDARTGVIAFDGVLNDIPGKRVDGFAIVCRESLLEGGAMGAVGFDGRMYSGPVKEPREQLGGGLLLNRTECVDGLESRLEFTGELLKIELRAQESAHGGFVGDIVFAKYRVEIGADFGGKGVEGGVVGLYEIRSGAGDGIAEAGQIGLAGNFFLGG